MFVQEYTAMPKQRCQARVMYSMNADLVRLDGHATEVCDHFTG